MSSAVVSTSAAQGRPFVFDDVPDLHGGTAAPSTSSGQALGCPVERSSTARLEHQESLIARFQSTINNQQSKISPATVTPASRLEIRPTPEMVSSGIPAIDALTGGLPRGCLTEVCGPASSGRTTFLLAALAAATRRGEFCTVVDASDALDPHSAASAGVALDRLLWVRCGEDSQQRNNSPQRHPSASLRAGLITQKDGCPILAASLAARMGSSSQATFEFDRAKLRKTGMKETGLRENVSQQSEHCLEQVLRATDLLLESGGFGLIILDLADLPPEATRRIPLTTWFRFRRAIEHTPTILLAIEPQPIASSCSSLLLQLGSENTSAAKRRKNVAHGGSLAGNEQASEVRKKINAAEDPNFAEPTHAHLLTELNINAELIRSRLERKPARSVTFATKTAWAG